MITDLYLYTDWANRRIFELTVGLSPELLDEPRPLGLGSLRAVLFHIWAADQIWLERWQGQPWREFPIDPHGISLEELQSRYQQVSQARWQLIQEAGDEIYSRQIRYLDMRRNEHFNRWQDLLVHVANHGVHHRAQLLNFLKHLDRKTTGGLDYLFYKIVHPSVPFPGDSASALRQWGLLADSGPGRQVVWRQDLWQDYFAYHDWANAQLWPLINDLDPAALHRDFLMGVGTIHKTLCHLRDAELWWLGIWEGGNEPFPKYEPGQERQAIQSEWQTIAQRRNQWVERLDASTAGRIVIATPAKIPVPVRLAESMLQLCGHGTHHRAQLVNMLRQLEIAAPPLDYVVWARANRQP